MLRSKNPRDMPRVDNKFLSDPRDLEAMRTTIQTARDGLLHASSQQADSNSILSTSGPLDWLLNALVPNLQLPKDNQLDTFNQAHCCSFFHLFGTCSVGKVVDESLKVCGVDNLRVCDGSIFPNATKVNPQQAILSMAWRAADIIVATGADDTSSWRQDKDKDKAVFDDLQAFIAGSLSEKSTQGSDNLMVGSETGERRVSNHTHTTW